MIRDNFAMTRVAPRSSASRRPHDRGSDHAEDVVVTLSHGGYAKAQPVSAYQAQRRGGRGKAATTVKDEDFIDKLFVANTHDTLLCFSTAASSTG
jgi:DNA gyrase/topoisomerase IV subunit A